jgi:hypothetical protein
MSFKETHFILRKSVPGSNMERTASTLVPDRPQHDRPAACYDPTFYRHRPNVLQIMCGKIRHFYENNVSGLLPFNI